MVDLLPRLKAKDLEVELLLFDGTDTPFKNELQQCGIKIHELGRGRNVYHPLNLLKLIPYLKHYDIVHVHNTASQFFAAVGSMLHSVILCTTEHNTYNRRRNWRCYKYIDRWMYSRYRCVICISEKTELNLINYLGTNSTKCITIPNGIDVARYAMAIPARISTKMGENIVKVMMVAGFRSQKDQPTLIKAMQFLPDRFHLFLIGDGEYRQSCENLVNELNLEKRIHFLGIRTDVPSLLKVSDCVVMASHWEGFGLAAVEGMAAGKPVIATDVPGLSEVVRGAGVLFNHGDVTALADAILKIGESPNFSKEVAGKCQQRAKEYDISKMVNGYLKVYEEIYNL